MDFDRLCVRAVAIALGALSAGALEGCGSRTEPFDRTDYGGCCVDAPPLRASADALADDASNEDAVASRHCAPTSAKGGQNGGPPSPTRSASYTCGTVFGWAWDGTECIAIVGCSCAGVGCGTLLGTRSECEAAYAHCP
jgi:hypothetical protein